MDVASPLQSQDKFREKSFFNQVQSSETNCVKDISSLPSSNKENENPEEALKDVSIHSESTEELKKVRSIEEELEKSIEKDKEMVLTDLESEMDQMDTEELEKKIGGEKVNFQEKSDSTFPHEKSYAEGFTDKPQSKDGPVPQPSPEIHNEICLEAVDDNESDVEMEEEDEETANTFFGL